MNSADDPAASSTHGGHAMVTVTEAATDLDRSVSQVRNYLNDTTHPLQGPPPPGRGRGRQRLVYADTIAEAKAHTAQYGRSRTRRSEIADLQRRVSALEEEVSHLRHVASSPPEHSSTTGSRADLQWALRHLAAASDALDDAAAKSRTSRDELRSALEAASRASKAQDEAEALVRHSDRIKSEIVGFMQTPADASSAT